MNDANGRETCNTPFFSRGSWSNRPCARINSPLISVFQSFNIDLFHLKHRLHHMSGFLLIVVMQHVDQHSWGDLPQKTEFVLEPAARRFLATVAVSFPQK